MIAKKYRITGRVEEEFFSTAQVWFLHWGRIYYRQGETTSGNVRFGIFVSPKRIASSVWRHRAKRRVATALEELLAELAWQPGEVVIVAGERVLVQECEQIRRDLRYFWEKNWQAKKA